jgi:hypothetical protein
METSTTAKTGYLQNIGNLVVLKVFHDIDGQISGVTNVKIMILNLVRLKCEFHVEIFFLTLQFDGTKCKIDISVP